MLCLCFQADEGPSKLKRKVSFLYKNLTFPYKIVLIRNVVSLTALNAFMLTKVCGFVFAERYRRNKT